MDFEIIEGSSCLTMRSVVETDSDDCYRNAPRVIKLTGLVSVRELRIHLRACSSYLVNEPTWHTWAPMLTRDAVRVGDFRDEAVARRLMLCVIGYFINS